MAQIGGSFEPPICLCLIKLESLAAECSLCRLDSQETTREGCGITNPVNGVITVRIWMEQCYHSWNLFTMTGGIASCSRWCSGRSQQDHLNILVAQIAYLSCLVPHHRTLLVSKQYGHLPHANKLMRGSYPISRPCKTNRRHIGLGIRATCSHE
jgi:hypothetical protein